MGRTDEPKHRFEKARDRLRRAVLAAEDVDAAEELLEALHPETSTTNFYDENGERETKSFSTLAAYAQALKRVGELADRRLVDFSSAEAVNGLFDDLATGDHPDVKDDGYGSSTLVQWQSAVIVFYRYHDGFDVAPDAIAVDRQDSSSVDERDVYTPEEVEQLRDAVTNTRDRCLLELLLNTGQRIRAIQTLRVKDVDPEKGVYYLNTDALGLKGADRNGTKRPLLGAKRAVYDWLKDHPTGEPDDALLTCLPSSPRGTPGEAISQSAMRERLRGIADDAGVDKPPNPHNFRHYFVTICKRDYDLDESTIKHLIGHGPGSRIMETTYQHLSDDDHVQAAEVAAGIRDPEEDEAPLTPTVCPTCSETLAPDAKACPGCGTAFSPDAKSVQEEIESDVKQSYRQTDPEDDETMDKIDALDELLEDPEIKEALLERADER